jgi:predicted transposase YdaD
LTSETAHQQQLMREALQHKTEENHRARDYILNEYQRHGLSEEERDEILAMLGIKTEADCEAALYLTSQIPKSGLASGQAKSVMPRTPPARASYL